jgi:5-methylcytosine-specific restriction endonuclease McrA
MSWTTPGSTPRWRALRDQVIARDGLTCRRCHRLTHRQRCSPRGCPLCLEVHHIDGAQGDPADTPIHRITVLCRGCNAMIGDPTSGSQPAATLEQRPLMAGVTPR